jgi:hypothetical protein
MNEHYFAVLADLRGRRHALEAQLRDVDAAIAGLQRLVGAGMAAPVVSVGASQAPAPEPSPESRFSKISVRWGVLWHLSEFARDYEKTAQVTDALVAGGYQSRGSSRFGNMVSAVLSNMKAKGEVEANDEGGYRITEAGRHTWGLIRQGTKFREAISSSEPSLLSAQ